MRYWTLFFLIIATVIYWKLGDVWPPLTSGNVAANPPEQADIPNAERTPWTYHDFKFTPLATYSIRARVLSREPYWFDSCARISPLDLALGWGPMSDPAVYKQLGISQGMRFYTWHWSGEPPIPSDDIALNSSNNHLIPSTDEIGRKINNFRPGDVILIEGDLVAVDGPNGWTWTSSTSRTDTGGHSCEVIWVTAATKLGR